MKLPKIFLVAVFFIFFIANAFAMENYIHDILANDKLYEPFRSKGGILISKVSEHTINKNFTSVKYDAIYKIFDSKNKFLKKVFSVSLHNLGSSLTSLKIRLVHRDGTYSDIRPGNIAVADKNTPGERIIFFEPPDLPNDSYVKVALEVKHQTNKDHLPYAHNEFLGSIFPIKKMRFSVNYPDYINLRYHLNDNSKRIQETLETASGRNRLSLIAADLPAFDATDTSQWIRDNPFVAITTLTSWKELSEWYTKKTEKSHYKLNGEMIQLVEQFKKTSKGKREALAEQLYDWVIKNINYQKSASPAEPLVPDIAVSTFEKKYGVCRDAATLLIALLRYSGINSYPVLVSSVKNPIIPLGAPFTQIFDHMVVAIKIDHKLIFVDTTAPKNWFAFELLPSALRKRPAMILYPDSSYEIITTPNYASKITRE